jgi:hypothetical protein
MKFKQVAGIVFISGYHLGSMGYNHLTRLPPIYKQDTGRPGELRPFFDHEKSAGPADFADASAAIPATVHNKTKTRVPQPITSEKLFQICTGSIPMTSSATVVVPCRK